MKRLSNAQKEEIKRTAAEFKIIIEEMQASPVFKLLSSLNNGQVKKQTAKSDPALDETKRK